MVFLFKTLAAIALLMQCSSAFVPPFGETGTRLGTTSTWRSSVVRRVMSENSEETDKQIMEEISWRAAKVKLEEADRQRFSRVLKRKPIKLSYLDARRWVQKNLGPDTREEFDDLVANGNLRTPYIPKQPEEYYTATGDWISWDHFLTMDPKVAGREVPPATGRFD